MATIRGRSLDDRLEGTDQADDIFGRGGSDTLLGLGGADRFEGGEVGDRILGGDGNDTVYGDQSLGFDETRDGPDTIDGQRGDDVIHGGAGRDVISGGSGQDTIFGGPGADVLFGFVGDDRLVGGAGADRLLGGEGRDTADYSASEAAVVIDLAAGSGAGGDAAGDRLDSIENLIGTSGDDVLAGNAADNHLTTLDGADTLTGGAGADTFSAGTGEWDAAMTLTDFSPAEGDRLDLSGYAFTPSVVLREQDGAVVVTATNPVPYWAVVTVTLQGRSLAELGADWIIPAPDRPYPDAW